MSLNLIIGNNLNDVDIAYQISRKISGKRYLHLCATKEIKECRCACTILFPTQVNYRHGCDTFNIATLAELERYLHRESSKNDRCVRISDERYILSKIIDSLFHDKQTRDVFSSMRFQIYELYQFLLFHGVAIDESVINKIGIDYSEFEKNIFTLYSLFSRTIKSITTGKSEDQVSEYLTGLNLEAGGFTTTRDCLKGILHNFVESTDVLILDGLLFFNDLTRFLLEHALNMNIEVYLTAKCNGKGSNYLFDIMYPVLFTELNQRYIKPHYETTQVSANSALQYVRDIYGNFTLEAPSEKLLQDESIQIIKPFYSREMEWRFIVERISQLLQDHCGKDIKKLRYMLKNDIAIVLAHKGYNEPLFTILKDVGLFIYNKEYKHTNISGRISKTFDDVYFNRLDFINENICYVDGTELTYAEKVKVFDSAFVGIKLKKDKPSIISYPVGQYVLKIYDILLNGINVNTFKTILFSNWQYNTKISTVKWDDFLGDFKTLECFFDGKTELDEWITIFERFLTLSTTATEDSLLRYHPINVVSNKSLSFFLDLLLFIKDLIQKISVVNGSIKNHIDILKQTVMRTDDFMLPTDATLEQNIVMELIKAVDNINASLIIKNVPASYFAENLHAMLKDFESDVELEEDNSHINDNDTDNNLYLNIVILENIKPFKYSFFPLFESSKYPRKYSKAFPFNKEIIEILKNPKYGLKRLPSNYKDLTAHLMLEENLFKNVLDFTTENLIITMTQKEDEHKNYISCYAHDIATLFDSDITWTDPLIRNTLKDSIFTGKKSREVYLERKKHYTLKELLMYKLCPRLYYHSVHTKSAYSNKFQIQFYFVAVLFSATMNEFNTHNVSNKLLYSTDETKVAIMTAEAFFDYIYPKYLPIFNIFTEYELSDICATVRKKIRNFFTDLHNKGIKGNTFTVVNVPENPIYQGNGYNLILEYDTKIYDMEKKVTRISQNDIFLDFLVLKTTDDTHEPLKHYAEMMEALARNEMSCDRVNLIFKMMNKINVQFDSQRYANDGIARTDTLVDDLCHTNFAYTKPYVSKFCQYCRINNICKEKAVIR